MRKVPKRGADLYGSRKLDAREKKIVKLIERGNRNEDIAVRLGTTPHMVKNHLRVIYDKLGMNSRLELALWSIAHRRR